ncbi:MAG: alpha/beta fold hydrolase [Acidimicrobiia bacterium]
MRVPSSDGVEVTVHDLGGSGPLVLLSHATGFHGFVWRPVADHLASNGFHCVALDYRGHGDTAAPPDWVVDWNRYGDDVTAVAEAVAEPGGIVGVGHSMGGAGVLMAALRHPGLFRALLVYEPVVMPTEGFGSTGPSPLVTGARRRRASFPSFEDAIANYAAKQPLQAFTPESLHAYVHGGFRHGTDGYVHLKCTPEHEARTFEASTSHDTWSRLGEITCPVWVVSGVPLPMQPSMVSRDVAERLADGRYLEFDDLDHFGPMTHPERIADLVRDLVASLE